MQNYNSDTWGFGGIFSGSIKVKVLSLLSLFLMLGCGSSTQHLIEQAHLTGDWTAVNKRMDTIQEREATRIAESCPRGTTRFCSRRFGDDRCSCVNGSEVRQALRDLGY